MKHENELNFIGSYNLSVIYYYEKEYKLSYTYLNKALSSSIEKKYVDT